MLVDIVQTKPPRDRNTGIVVFWYEGQLNGFLGSSIPSQDSRAQLSQPCFFYASST
jgi:hypothetical protein